MDTKYIFVTGGVVSSLGKGITAASLGRILKNRGAKVLLQKLDPYLNADPGKLSPLQHGEVFVTDDGAEMDLDIGHYERFVDVNLSVHSDTTAGMVYRTVLDKEEKGVYEGATVQVIPHITNEIKERILRVSADRDVDVVITEIGGTVGDIECQPFMEAIRQLKKELGKKNIMYIHVTLLPYLPQSEELKTKPTQHSVKELRSLGIQPDLLIVRTSLEIDRSSREKIALFCDLEAEEVIENLDAESIYEIPEMLEDQNLSDLVAEHLHMDLGPKCLGEWAEMVDRFRAIDKKVEVALIAKYIDMKDSYISLLEALNHAGIKNGVDVEVRWIDAEQLNERNIQEKLQGVCGIIDPAGFGERGLRGMILASRYARKNNIPFLGISMGMHAGIMDLLEEECGEDLGECKDLSRSSEDIIKLVSYTDEDERRLGLHPCKLKDSMIKDVYGEELIYERHRSKYAFNLKHEDKLKESGAKLAGYSPDGKYLEAFELEGHPWYVGVQFQPEFRSRPTNPCPLITSFLGKVKETKVNN